MDYRERWELKDYLFRQVLERRILLLQAGVTLLFLGFLLNFWYLQGVHGDAYAGLAENNRLRQVPLRPTRGVVYDRNGEIIAASRPSLDLLLRREGPHELNPQVQRLSQLLNLPLEELQRGLDQVRQRPIFEPLLVQEDVRLDHLARIEARRERFPSVEIRQSARRHYIEGALAAHAVGYVGEVSEAELRADAQRQLAFGDIVGKSGVEKTHDETLRGRRGSMLVSVNNLGRHMGDGWVERDPVHGQGLTLTLDLRLQRALTRALGEEGGAGVFLDPWTGDILAIASSPSFDANMFVDGISHAAWRGIIEDPRRPLHDRAIASFYAPGSTFKVLVAIAALEEGVIDPRRRVWCPGSAEVFGRRRLCWKRGGHGWVDLARALTHSCNVYFYELGKQLDIDVIHRYGAMFGLGRTTAIDIPGEEPGILPSKAWKLKAQGERWYPGDTVSVAIGQGLLAVTPIQMARMIAGVATTGRLPRPRVSADRPVEWDTVSLQSSTFAVVREALRRAVEEGTGREANVGRRFSVSGKTGTAQVYQHSAGVDSEDLPKMERDHAWFVGYAPVEEPRVAFAVVVEHGGHGGRAAAPVARKVLEQFFTADARNEREGGERRAGLRMLREASGVQAASAE